MSKQRKRKQVGHSNGCTSDDDSAKRLCVDHAPHDGQKQYHSSTVELESTPGSAEVDQQDTLRSKDFDDSSSEDQGVVTHDFDTCFGMVRVPTSHLRLSVLLDSCDPSIEVAVKIEGDIVTIRNSTSLEYGGLLGRNTAGSKALKQLHYQHGASFEGYLLQKETKAIGKNAYDLHVIVYGMQSQSDCCSKLLDSAGLFLQHPHLRDLSAPYRNPHYLCNPNSQIDLIEETRSTLSETITTKVAQVLEDSDPLKHQLLEVIDSAQGPETYSSTSSSPRLRTPLKAHQSKALSMMREKESGRLEKNEFGSVWTTFESKKGDLRYKNLVTGSVQITKPRICRGGLLADDMGLGKTLSTIALIASSLDIMTHLPGDHVNCRSTLIVCPLSLLRQWESQILEHVHPGKMSYKIFHGATKQDASALNEYDVVLTTYDVVVSEASKSCKSPGVTTIHSIEWHRVVLDEAHTIRNRRTKRYRNISALKARHRWCLTGTPIYNSLEDFGSLLGFLGVYPFDNASTFNSRIGIPVKNGSSQGLRTLQKLVQGVCLRRTKDAISHDLQLPACHKAICRVQFSEKERRDYEVLKKNYAAILRTDSCANKAASSTTRIFLTLLRLRQFCDHGVDLLPSDIRELLENSANSEAYAKCLINPVESCAACQKGLKQNAEDGAVFPLRDCGHVFCSRCEKKVRDKSPGQDAECIACVRHTNEHRMGDETEPKDNELKPSSKVLALLHNLIEERNQVSRHPIKRQNSIVFSTWTTMLDLVEPALRREGFKFVRIDGSKSEIDRRSAIEKFRSEKDCNVLLASIGTAGVGLDLTVASRVHLLEPQWTPMVEAQALDRVHRMGQTQDVIATRYIVENSIEEYLVNVQQVKSAVIGQLFTSKSKVETESTRERLAKYLTEEAT